MTSNSNWELLTNLVDNIRVGKSRTGTFNERIVEKETYEQLKYEWNLVRKQIKAELKTLVLSPVKVSACHLPFGLTFSCMYPRYTCMQWDIVCSNILSIIINVTGE